MIGTIGIRREDKDSTEKRAPLTPSQVKKLIQEDRIVVKIQNSNNRIFKDKDYTDAGAILLDQLEDCNIILGVKEIPTHHILPQQAYCFFSHTIKGQSYNLPMLKRMLDLRNTLMDYEMVTDEKGRRLIFFGRYAGYAGMIDVLWAVGLRLKWESLDAPFDSILQAINYPSLSDAKNSVKQIGQKIAKDGISQKLAPFICGFAGYGQVSQGAQEVFDLLPHENIPAYRLKDFINKGDFSNKKLYKVVFKESDMVVPKNVRKKFDLQEYYNYPENYDSIFKRYLPHLTILVNGIYWEPIYPRLVTKHYLREERALRLRVIGDIACDIEGSIECNAKTTNSSNPIYVYNPKTDQIIDGYEGEGVIILAVDKLPSELPREATESFGKSLMSFIPSLAQANYWVSFLNLSLPAEFKKAVITHNGQLTPDFKYLSEYLKQVR
jgi:alanine dehydrogenase